MQGLRKQEDKKFERFVELIQKEASKQGAIYFVDCEEGHDKITDEFDMLNLEFNS